MRHPRLLLIAVVGRVGSGLAASLAALYVTQIAGLDLRAVGLRGRPAVSRGRGRYCGTGRSCCSWG